MKKDAGSNQPPNNNNANVTTPNTNQPDLAQAQADQILYSYHFESSWTSELNTLLQDFLVRIYADSGDKAVAQMEVGMDAVPTFQAQAEMYMHHRTAALVTQLDNSTRQMLQATLRDDMTAGKTPKEIEKDLRSNYAFSEARAETIARTETAFAWNHGGISMYQMAGAKAVNVYDGDSDAECAQANGEVWSFDYALAHLLEHPRCVRSFGPAIGATSVDRGTPLEPQGVLQTEATGFNTGGDL